MDTEITIVVPESPRALALHHVTEAEARIERGLSEMLETDVKAAVRYQGSIDEPPTEVTLWLSDPPTPRVAKGRTRRFERQLKEMVSAQTGVVSGRIGTDVREVGR